MTEHHLPVEPQSPRLLHTAEGASAFPVDDPLVRLVFNYGSFLPASDTYYGTPEEMMRGFIDAVTQAGHRYPLLALQYAAWQRDPRRGKGNRSQPPWVIAVLAGLPQCVQHPRFAELVARCIVRPDDAHSIIMATKNLLGDNQFSAALKQGIARGLDQMSDYQLTKYANKSISLLPERRRKKGQRKALPHPEHEDRLQTSILVPKVEGESVQGAQTLRLVDVLGICKRELSPRLFALYRYLHAPTRQQEELLPLLTEHLPLFDRQRLLRAQAPSELQQVASWVAQALEARMTMEQIFSATGQQRAPLALDAPDVQDEQQPEEQVAPSPESLAHLKMWAQRQTVHAQGEKDSSASSETEHSTQLSETETTPDERPAEDELAAREIRAELWKTLLTARVSDEQQPDKQVPFLGDVAFLRNLRGMYQSGIALESLDAEARRRRFNGLWPFQLLSAARQIRQGRRRGRYQVAPCPEVLPVLDTIFETVALQGLPRKPDGNFYRLLGMADVSGSMEVTLGGKESSAQCMDAAIAFSVAFSYTTRTNIFSGLAGTWSNTFYPSIATPGEGPLDLAWDIRTKGRGGGGDGTQVFGSMLSLIDWLQQHPAVPRPEVLVVLSDMQFHPPSRPASELMHMIPASLRNYVTQPEFAQMPPLAAAIVLYRRILGSDASLVLWNLAAYEGSPVPSGMQRVLTLSGFDANSFSIIEQWLQAGSPGDAMPVAAPAGSGESNSSFEAVLAALRRY